MKSNRFYGLLFVALGTLLFIWLGVGLERLTPGAGSDFKELLLQQEVLTAALRSVQSSGASKRLFECGWWASQGAANLFQVVTVLINLPTVFTFVLPLSLLAWGPSHLLWLTLNAFSLILAAFLSWNLVEDRAPSKGCWCTSWNNALTSVSLFLSGNGAGIVVGATVVGVWCILRGRFPSVGVTCLAISLVLSPPTPD